MTVNHIVEGSIPSVPVLVRKTAKIQEQYVSLVQVQSLPEREVSPSW